MSHPMLKVDDHGYRVIVVTDAVCSSSDEGHDAMLKLYRERYSLQIEAVGSEASRTALMEPVLSNLRGDSTWLLEL